MNPELKNPITERIKKLHIPPVIKERFGKTINGERRI
jgi:hypothetical protein